MIRAWLRETSAAIARLVALFFLTGLATPAIAVEEAVEEAEAEENRPSIEIGWTTEPPEIDGIFEPDEWSAAVHVDGLTQATPDEGEEATQHTEIWLMTDGESLFVAARLWDTNPEEIVAYAMRRDGDTTADDRFGFTIDPFFDRQNGYFFQVNSNAARRDALLEGGGFAANWDGRWYAKTSVDEEGWIVEIALPFATINFDPNTDVWGLNMARGIRRRNEIDRWSDPVRNRFLTAMGRAGNLTGMKGIRQGLGLQIVPSVTVRRVDDSNPIAETEDERHYTRADPSLDTFFKPVPEITTALTINTDFAEAAVDVRQVNLSRFELFFPEQRDFFLQDTLLFDFADLEENGRPFFSRRIGLGPDGEEEGITAGGKITGRVGDFKIGILNVILDEHDDVDQQNVLVARGAYNIGESSIGAILTNGDPEAKGDNTLIGADLNYRNSDFRDGKTLNATAWVQSSFNDPDTGPTVDPDAIDGNGLAYGASVVYPNDRYNWLVSARSFDDEFDPALGFANRIDVRDFAGEFRRRWRPEVPGLERIDSKLEGRLVTDATLATVETGELVWSALELVSPIGDGVRFQYRHRYEFVDSAFANLNVALGRYHFDEGEIQFTASRNRWIGGVLAVGHGTFFDGDRTRGRADVTIRFSKFVQTTVTYGVDDIRLPGGDELIHLLTTRLSLFFTPDISWITLLQFDNVSDSMGINSRFRWIIEDGREFFIVLNQGFDTRDDVQATRTEPLVKLQWTFRF